MQLRYGTERPTTRTTRTGIQCCACGFADEIPLEDTGEGMLCGICTAALNFGTSDPARDMLVWLPEIPQDSLAHLARVMALLMARNARWKGAARKIVQPLKERSDVLDRIIRDMTGHPIRQGWPLLPEDVRLALLPGLRLFRTAFEVSEIKGWADGNGSLAGYGDALLQSSNWFAETLPIKVGVANPGGPPTPRKLAGNRSRGPDASTSSKKNDPFMDGDVSSLMRALGNLDFDEDNV